LSTHGHEWLQQLRGRHCEADTTYTVAVLKREQYAVVIFGGPHAILVQVTDEEWQGW
jgi:hypothetical protein